MTEKELEIGKELKNITDKMTLLREKTNLLLSQTKNNETEQK